MAKPTWDQYFDNIRQEVSKRSPDTRTKVGCVMVGPDKEIRMTGYNGFVDGIEERPERLHENEKLFWTSHAEEGSIALAVKLGVSLNNCVCYVGRCPCHRCMRQTLIAGIKEFVVDDTKIPNRWKESCYYGLYMLLEKKGIIRLVNDDTNRAASMFAECKRFLDKKNEKS